MTTETLIGGAEAAAGEAQTQDQSAAAGGETTPGAATEAGAAGNETSADGAGAADALAGDAAGDQTEAGTDTQSGAPEVYADFTMPEGVTFDAEVGDDLKAFAKQAGLSQEQAQAVADMGVKLMTRAQQQNETLMGEVRSAWADDTRKDPDIGGDKLTATIAAGNKALAKYGTPALRELLTESGLGNHPEFVRVFAKIGATLSEDTVVTGHGGSGGGPRDVADRLFGGSGT